MILDEEGECPARLAFRRRMCWARFGWSKVDDHAAMLSVGGHAAAQLLQRIPRVFVCESNDYQPRDIYKHDGVVCTLERNRLETRVVFLVNCTQVQEDQIVVLELIQVELELMR